MDKNITIEFSKIENLKKMLKKINRIEKKQGYKLTKIISVENKRSQLKEYYIDDMEYNIRKKFIDNIIVCDVTLSIDDDIKKENKRKKYQLMVRIDHLENTNNDIFVIDDNIFNHYTMKELLTLSPKCNHCNTRRKRKTTYIIKDAENDKVYQIGKTCLIEYTTEKNILDYAEYLENIAELENIIEYDKENFTSDNFQGQLYNVLDIIASSFLSVGKRGFTSKYNATKDNISTKDDVLNILFLNKENFNLDDIKEKIKWYLSIDKSKYIDDYLKNDNDFTFKMEKLLQYEYTTEKNISTLVCFPIEYDNIKRKVKLFERNKNEIEKIKKTNYKEKDKVELNNLTLTSNKKYQNDIYNTTTTYYYFLDDNNITYLWKSSRIISALEDAKEKINLKGTIKKIDNNKIILTRCKVI